MPTPFDLPIDSLSDLISPEAFRAHDEAVRELEEKKRALMNADKIDIDTATDDELRFLLKHLLKKQREREAAAAQPLGVDRFSGLPVHFEPPECPLCVKFPNRVVDGKDLPVCHDCNDPIPLIRIGEADNVAPWIESASITHMHMHTVSGGKGEQIRVPGRRHLCLACFRTDYEKTTGRPCDI